MTEVGILTTPDKLVTEAENLMVKMEIYHPYLNETLRRIGGISAQEVRNLMFICEARGWIERTYRDGRTYYTRIVI